MKQELTPIIYKSGHNNVSDSNTGSPIAHLNPAHIFMHEAAHSFLVETNNKMANELIQNVRNYRLNLSSMTPDEFKQNRKDLGFTQKTLAYHLKCNQSQISLIERGKEIEKIINLFIIKISKTIIPTVSIVFLLRRRQ